VRRQPVNIKGLVAETSSLLHVLLPSRIELAIGEVPDSAVISGQPAQLQQVLLNLCNNAAQSIDGAGRIEIETEVHRITTPQSLSHDDLPPGRHLRILVSDTGRGIEETTLEHLFEPFFTTRLAGTGLGLATVREIVREHGGAINVWSLPGVGSRFEVWLPCITAAASVPRDEVPTFRLGRGETVMVVTIRARGCSPTRKCWRRLAMSRLGSRARTTRWRHAGPIRRGSTRCWLAG